MIGPLRRIRDRARRSRSSRRYDVVIIGGGVHGLAIAYELAKRGVKDVAVLDRSYLGSGRERPQHRDHPLQLPHAAGRRVLRRVGPASTSGLSAELGLQRAVQPARPPDARPHRARRSPGCGSAPRRTSSSGVDSRVIDRDEIRKLAPALDLSDRPRFPILAALYHPPGGIIRHDAVVWGYARRAAELGVDIHPYTEVTGIDVADGRVTGVQTTRGPDPHRHGRQRDRRLGVDDRARWSGCGCRS